MAPQPRDLETLTANRGMRHKMSFEDIDYILSHQKKVNLPDRRWLQVWNSFDIQNFRGFNADAEEYEKNRNDNIKRTVEIREAANSGMPTANLEFLNRQQMAMGQMANVIQQMQAQQAANDEVIRNGVRADVSVMIYSLRRGQHELHERDRMMQAVQERHLDIQAEDRRVMMGLMDRIARGLEEPRDRGAVRAQMQQRQNNEVNLTYMQHMHDQTMHMVQSNQAILSQFLNTTRLDPQTVIRVVHDDLLDRYRIHGFGGGAPPPPPAGAMPVRSTLRTALANEDLDFANLFSFP